MSERSFFYKGYQFPVCARCTGVIIGQILGAISFSFLILSNDTIGFLCFLMFLDWWLQRVGLLQSTKDAIVLVYVDNIIGEFSCSTKWINPLFWQSKWTEQSTMQQEVAKLREMKRKTVC